MFDAEMRRVVGWCWSPDAPFERLAVDIMVGDAVLGSVVAALPNPDALEAGYGDGRCGFSFALPSWVLAQPGRVAISARERRTRRIVDRIVHGSDDAPDPGFAQIEESRTRLGPLSADLAVAIGTDAASAARLRAACGELGALLRARARQSREPLHRRNTGSVHVTLEALEARIGRLVLPAPHQPNLTIVLPATADAARTQAVLRALLPGLKAAACELLLTGASDDVTHRLLPALVENLRYVPGPHAERDAARLARGAHIAFLAPADADMRSAGLLALATALARYPGHVLLGDDCLAAIRRGPGLPDAAASWPVIAGQAWLPLRIALPRALYGELGQLDANLSGNPALQSADLFLRARLYGADLAVWTPPIMAATPAGPAHGARAAMASAAFHANWPGQSRDRISA